jgi:ligand-binding sensor domain-containing protein
MPGADSSEQAPYAYFTSGVQDAQGDLWLATYGAGVYHYDGQRLIHHPVQEGERPVLLFSIYADRAGVLWLGTTEAGVYRFDGERFERFRP